MTRSDRRWLIAVGLLWLGIMVSPLIVTEWSYRRARAEMDATFAAQVEFACADALAQSQTAADSADARRRCARARAIP